MSEGQGASPADERPSRAAGLTLKQAAATLVVALAVGLGGAALELMLELRRLQQEVRQDTQLTLETVRGSAVEAAYQLNPSLARQVIEGLMGNLVVAGATLRDDFDNVLADHRREHPSQARWAEGFFADLLDYQLTLEHLGAGGRRETVGSLTLTLSPAVLAERFEARAQTSILANVLRALAICALLVALFHVLVTSPLLRLTRAILRVDPARPGGAVLPSLRGHARDELGQLRGALAGLFAASQRGLDERDRAEGELQALTRELERRVEDRTRALAEVNGRLLESIGYARRIQTSLLPDPAVLQDVIAEVAFSWEPLEDVGGDYLWFERGQGRRSLLAVVDCTGHGVPGAFMALVVASALDHILRRHAGLVSPAEILLELDRDVRVRLRQDRPAAASDDGLEAAVCVWDADSGELTFAGAGLPLIYARGGSLEEIRGDRAALGYASLPAPRGFTEHRLRPEPGASFYLLTDGVPDQMVAGRGRLLGRRRLREMLQELQDLPLTEQIEALQRRLDALRGEQAPRDDMTLVAFRPLPAEGGERSLHALSGSRPDAQSTP